MAEPQGLLRTYRGNCHCKEFVYEAEIPEIHAANQCNCSICTKKGALWVFPVKDSFRWVKGDEEDLTEYTFGRMLVGHKFCPACGTSLLARGFTHEPQPGEEPLFVLNPLAGAEEKKPISLIMTQARAIQGLNIYNLERRPFDGASLPPPYEPPLFAGPEPEANVRGGRVYEGSCHCGAVTLALKSKPLDSSYSSGIAECNCSICSRLGVAWLYPKANQVVMNGQDHLTYYIMGNGMLAKGFCEICGVPIDNKFQELNSSETSRLSYRNQIFYAISKDGWFLNAKILNDVDLSQMRVRHLNGWNDHKPAYVNP
ncbi:glutathione-dependent formaldehyde-activating enzyme [Apiospora saccharicola]|uniref:Glutathione-dependent formaldehyde-activating enzyme n=1 Tax=Apiospora saccharicola TaxID=335842 RepID=A0ABR1UN44_9PEZI